jgi:plasmid maintenance system antidote protein VapI
MDNLREATLLFLRFEKASGLRADTLCRMQTAQDLAAALEHEKKISVKRFEDKVPYRRARAQQVDNVRDTNIGWLSV